MTPPDPCDEDSSPLLHAVANRIVSEAYLKNFAALRASHPDIVTSYEFRVCICDFNLWQTLQELRHAVVSLTSASTSTQARISTKFYVISWCSLSDTLAALISEVHELGIDPRDINLTMVMRNTHVLQSDLPTILDRYASRLHYAKYADLRNQIVHRGHLEDQDLLTFEGARQRVLINRRFGVRDETTDTDILAKLRSILATKQSLYQEHLGATADMLHEMSTHLAATLAAHRFPTSA